ncbi:MAG: transposase [Rhodobacteraceae bacterium]|nr:transposase [Paracoccaceae bacterium]
MAHEGDKREEIGAKLRLADAFFGQGVARVDGVREVHIASQTHDDRRRQDGGMGARAARDRIAALGATAVCIDPGSPWETGDVERVTARFRGELLNREILRSLRAFQITLDNLAAARQDCQAAQRPRRPPTGTRNPPPDGSEARHAPTRKTNTSDRAARLGYHLQSPTDEPT